MEIQDVRKLFPYLRHNKIYFNHASIGPLSEIALTRINDFLIKRSETHIDDLSVITETTEEAKNKIAKMLNCQIDRLAFFDNTSNSLNVVALGMRWQKGDRIILNDIEFPSNVYPFLNLRSLGVEIDFVHTKDRVVTAEDIIDWIRPETKLISISYVQFLSGYRTDLKKIGDICREKGIIFCVDAAQGLGAFTLDVEDAKVDFLACGTQKWLMGLRGLAFIYISDDLQSRLAPRYIGWASVEDNWALLDYDLVLKKTAEDFQSGTISIIGVNALNASIDLLEMVGFNKISSQVLDNSEYFIKKLDENGFNPIMKEYSRRNLSGIVSFKSHQAKAYFHQMTENNISCSMREGMVRFSPHFYNTKEEIDNVISILLKT